jgi:hypothetical protein
MNNKCKSMIKAAKAHHIEALETVEAMYRVPRNTRLSLFSEGGICPKPKVYI